MSVDPGYGNALAPVGSEEWAKNWRLAFQKIAKELPRQPQRGLKYFETGKQYRAWTLLTDGTGKHFADFDTFCLCPQPYGLGIEPTKFRAYLEAEIGKRAVELETVPVDQRRDNGANQHTGPNEDSGHCVPNPSVAAEKKAKRLRAVTRAPEIVQELYRQGKITQATAAKLGPKKPTPEQAAKVAEARQGIERLDLSKPAKEVRKAVDAVVRQTLDLPTPTALDAAKKACAKLNELEWSALMEWMREQLKQAG